MRSRLSWYGSGCSRSIARVDFSVVYTLNSGLKECSCRIAKWYRSRDTVFLQAHSLGSGERLALSRVELRVSRHTVEGLPRKNRLEGRQLIQDIVISRVDDVCLHVHGVNMPTASKSL